MIQKVLVPVDGSGHSIKTLRLAADLSEKYQAEMIVVNVRTRDLSSEVKYLAEEKMMDFDELDLARVAENIGKKIIEKAIEDSGIARDCATRVLLGNNVAQAISRFADHEGVDVIVIGSRGLSDLKGFVMGSVSYEVNHLSGCTCINVK